MFTTSPLFIIFYLYFLFSLIAIPLRTLCMMFFLISIRCFSLRQDITTVSLDYRS